jgi:tetratricopeptide (TPR) repeat protein
VKRVAALLVLLYAGAAQAAPHDPRAEQQLELAMSLYSQDRLDDAVAAIRAGQAIEGRPEFLYALGQIERRRGHCLPAIDYYEHYLASRPSAQAQAATRTQIERCRAELPVATDQEARAQLHFQAGEADFRLGRFSDAVMEWKTGYDLSPRALFLLDLGQAYRRLGDPRNALAMYERFASTLSDGDPKRLEVEETIASLRAEAASMPDKVVAATVDLAPPESHHPPPSYARRHWWIFPTVAGIAVAVGLGVGLGIYYGRPENRLECANTLSCRQLPGAN